jgi:hypothetical protein
VTVAYAGAKPADADLKVLQDRVNKLIAEDRPVEVTEQDRKAAEALYTKSPVNGQYIYEKKEPPASVTSLTIVTIPETTVSVSASKDFVTSTKLVGAVEVLRFNHREAKQELEVCFQLVDSAPVQEKAAEAKQAPAQSSTSSVLSAPSLKADTVPDASVALFNTFFDAIKKTRPDITLSEADMDQIKRTAALKSNVILTCLKNSSYASGFASRMPSK